MMPAPDLEDLPAVSDDKMDVPLFFDSRRW